jgi:hypothetical protein
MPEQSERKPLAWQRRTLGCGLLVMGLVLIAALIGAWSAASATATEERSIPLLFGLFDLRMSPDEALLVVVVIAGGLGATANTATEFAYRVGDDRLDRSYLWWYPMRFLIASTLALLFYFVVRGGLLDPTPSAADNVNVYVFAGLAGLAGLFSTQAVRLLGRIFGALPGVDAPYAEPVPRIDQLGRGEHDDKGRPGEFVLRGHGFADGSEVSVDDTPRPSRVIDDTRIGVRLDPAHDEPGDQLKVVVRSPNGPGGELRASEATDVVVPERGSD